MGDLAHADGERADAAVLAIRVGLDARDPLEGIRVLASAWTGLYPVRTDGPGGRPGTRS